MPPEIPRVKRIFQQPRKPRKMPFGLALVVKARKALEEKEHLSLPELLAILGIKRFQFENFLYGHKVSLGMLKKHALFSKITPEQFEQLLSVIEKPKTLDAVSTRFGFSSAGTDIFFTALNLKPYFGLKLKPQTLASMLNQFILLRELQIPEFPAHNAFLVFSMIPEGMPKQTIRKHLAAISMEKTKPKPDGKFIKSQENLIILSLDAAIRRMPPC